MSRPLLVWLFVHKQFEEFGMLGRLSRITRICSVSGALRFSTAPIFAERLKCWNSICAQQTNGFANGNDSTRLNPQQGEALAGNQANGLAHPKRRSFDVETIDVDNEKDQLCYINGKLSDLDTPVSSDMEIRYVEVPKEDDAMFSRKKETRDFFKTMWHSSAHILAYALEQYYGDKIQLLHGPAGDGIPYCFFYDVILDVFVLFHLNRQAKAPTNTDLENIQKIINSILRHPLLFEHRTVFPFLSSLSLPGFSLGGALHVPPERLQTLDHFAFFRSHPSSFYNFSVSF